MPKKYGPLVLMFFGAICLPNSMPQEPGVEIINSGKIIAKQFSQIDAGPDPVQILYAHYFPGLVFYYHGNNVNAYYELTYFLERPEYTKTNPRQSEFFSIGHYVRGMIYLYHSNGISKYALAQKDFEASIRWNPRNFFSYLELATVYVQLGFKDQARNTLQKLLAQNPGDSIAQEVKKLIAGIQTPDKK